MLQLVSEGLSGRMLINFSRSEMRLSPDEGRLRAVPSCWPCPGTGLACPLRGWWRPGKGGSFPSVVAPALAGDRGRAPRCAQMCMWLPGQLSPEVVVRGQPPRAPALAVPLLLLGCGTAGRYGGLAEGTRGAEKPPPSPNCFCGHRLCLVTQRCLGSSDLNPFPGTPLGDQPGLEHCQGGDSHSFSGQPGPVSQHPYSKKFLPYIQSKSALP